jgi:hypothetical protein
MTKLGFSLFFLIKSLRNGVIAYYMGPGHGGGAPVVYTLVIKIFRKSKFSAKTTCIKTWHPQLMCHKFNF